MLTVLAGLLAHYCHLIEGGLLQLLGELLLLPLQHFNQFLLLFQTILPFLQFLVLFLQFAHPHLQFATQCLILFEQKILVLHQFCIGRDELLGTGIQH